MKKTGWIAGAIFLALLMAGFVIFYCSNRGISAENVTKSVTIPRANDLPIVRPKLL